MSAVFWLLDTILYTYMIVIFVYVVMSWLMAFNIVNRGNQIVDWINQVVYDLTEPVLSRIRRFMPNLGSVDLAPMALILGIIFLRILLNDTIAPAFGVRL